MGPVMRAAGNQIELVPMTFAFPPARPGGAPVFNFRTEGRHFAKSNRCLIPASAFFEFTAKSTRRPSTDRPQGLTDHGNRRPVERGAGQPSADVHDVDNGARTRRRPVPQSASRGGPARRLVCLDLLDQGGGGTAATSSRGIARRCDCAGRKQPRRQGTLKRPMLLPR
jgi:hypothetical protein